MRADRLLKIYLPITLAALVFFPAHAAFGSAAERIVFVSDRDGNNEIYICNPDGTEQTRLTHDPSSDTVPVISPDGRRIAFTSGRDGNGEIYTMNADGSSPTRLTDNPYSDAWPAYSPDGTRIAFESERSGDCDLYTIDCDGTDLRRVTANPWRDARPQWSADASQVFFCGNQTNFEVAKVNLDGTGETNLTNNPAADFTEDVSHDGGHILFMSDRDVPGREFYQVNPDGSGVTRITHTSPAASNWGPKYSPDDSRIAFGSDRGDIGDPALYTMNADGSGVTKIVDSSGSDHAPDWGVAAASETSASPWAMFGHDAQHTRRSLYVGSQTAELKWVFPTGAELRSSPAIAADGTIYVGSVDRKLYAINPDGTEKWAYAAGGEVHSSPAIGADGTVYVGSWDKSLHAVNPDGTRRWVFPTEGEVYSSPTIVADRTIFVGSFDGKLYAVNSDGTLRWSYDTGGVVSSSPAVGVDGTIYVGNRVNELHAVNPDGTEKWVYPTGGWLHSSPAIGADGTVFIGSYDGKLYAINPDGSTKWSYAMILYGGSSPAVGTDGSVYVGNASALLEAINPDGTTKWVHMSGGVDNVFSSPAMGADGSLYVGGGYNKLRGINPDGTLKWAYTTVGWVASSPAIGADGTVYAGDDSGRLYAIAGPEAPPDDATAPGPVTEFESQAGDGQVGLMWKNPTDTDFFTTRILRSTVDFAASPTDTAGQTQAYEGSAETTIDTGLVNGLTYHYAAFARDATGNWSEPATASAIPFAPDTEDPSVTDIQILPAVPSPGQPVTVTARITDNGPVGAVCISYSLYFEQPVPPNFPSSWPRDGTQEAPMVLVDAANGIYQGALPQQSAGTLVNLRVDAVDASLNWSNGIDDSSSEPERETDRTTTPISYSVAPGAAARKKIAVAFVKFSDDGIGTFDPNTDYEKWARRRMEPLVNSYYAENSYGRVQFDVDVFNAASPAELPLPWNHYVVLGDFVEAAFCRDAYDLLRSSVDYAQYDAVMLVHPGDSEQNGGSKADPETGLLPNAFFPAPHKTIVLSRHDGWNTIAHEFGHVLGAADRYSNERQYGRGHLFHYDLMAESTYQNHMSSFTKIGLGWLSRAEAGPGEYEVTVLPRLSYGSGVKSYGASLDGHHYYLLEARSFSKEDSHYDTGDIGHDGVVLYDVDAESLGTSVNVAHNPKHERFKNLQPIGIAQLPSLEETGEILYQVDLAASRKFTLVSKADSRYVVRVDPFTLEDYLGYALDSLPPTDDSLASPRSTESTTLPDLDLHAWTPGGEHVGVDYATGSYETEIADAYASGDLEGGREWIYVPKDTAVSFSVSSHDTERFIEQHPEYANATSTAIGAELTMITMDSSGTARAGWSAQTTVTPGADLTSTVLSLAAPAGPVSYGSNVALTGALTSAGTPAAARTVTVWKSLGVAEWSADGTATWDAATQRYVALRPASQKAFYQMRFAGDSGLLPSASATATATCRAYLSRPWTSSRIVRRNRGFYTFGYLKPRHSGHTLLRFYRYVRGRWRLHASRSARNYNYLVYTRYKLAFRLRYAGRYYVKTYHSDAGHAPTWSASRALVVR